MSIQELIQQIADQLNISATEALIRILSSILGG